VVDDCFVLNEAAAAVGPLQPAEPGADDGPWGIRPHLCLDDVKLVSELVVCRGVAVTRSNCGARRDDARERQEIVVMHTGAMEGSVKRGECGLPLTGARDDGDREALASNVALIARTALIPR
jgi:hypothetical protein